MFAPFLAGGDSFLAGGDTFFLGDTFLAGGDYFLGDFFSKVMSCFSGSVLGGETFFFLSFFEGWTGFELSGFPFDSFLVTFVFDSRVVSTSFLLFPFFYLSTFFASGSASFSVFRFFLLGFSGLGIFSFDSFVLPFPFLVSGAFTGTFDYFSA